MKGSMFTEIEGEVWKDIADWSFNQVSNKGRVRVLPGGKVGNHLVTNIELRKQSIHSDGYMIITQNRQRVRVHHLVLDAFDCPCPPGQECRHLNNNRSDNRWPENIEWGTRKDNQQDRVEHSTTNNGERNGRAKLTEAQIIEIRNRSEPATQLAKEYGVVHQTISRIRNGTRWHNSV